MTRLTELGGIASQLSSLYRNSVSENNTMRPEDRLQFPYSEMAYAMVSLLMEIDQANTGGYLSQDLVDEKTDKLRRYTKQGRQMKGIIGTGDVHIHG